MDAHEMTELQQLKQELSGKLDGIGEKIAEMIAKLGIAEERDRRNEIDMAELRGRFSALESRVQELERNETKISNIERDVTNLGDLIRETKASVDALKENKIERDTADRFRWSMLKNIGVGGWAVILIVAAALVNMGADFIAMKRQAPAQQQEQPK